jgi:hypothetical protein
MNTRGPARLRFGQIKSAFFTESECIPESSHSVIGGC